MEHLIERNADEALKVCRKGERGIRSLWLVHEGL
jgi:hypothetical protein